MLQEGQVLRINEITNKRIWARVIKVDSSKPFETTLTIKPFKKAAPKSQLRKRNKFSKYKGDLLLNNKYYADGKLLE